MGWHGLSKVDCVTVWFAGANWNWTMSPTPATRLFGVYERVPFELPTCTTWTVTSVTAEHMLATLSYKVVITGERYQGRWQCLKQREQEL